MKHALWIGTETSFHESQELQAFYRGQDPKALYDDDEINETFCVKQSRPGVSLLSRHGDITILKVHGTLYQSHSWWHAYSDGAVTSYEAIMDALDIAAKDLDTKKILMDFSTGGGVVKGIDVATRKIKWARKIKPVEAHVDSSAFSAGYWLASTAARITASTMAEVGSIGTLLVTQTVVGAAEQAGVKFHVFRSGEFKALGLPYEEMSEKAAKHIQERLDKCNEFFLSHVSMHRGLPKASKNAWAEGLTFYADEAIEVGLIDQVINLDEVVGGAASQSSTSEKWSIEMTISQAKLAQIAAGANPESVLTAEELKAYNEQLAENLESEDEPEAEEETPEGEEEANEPSTDPVDSDVLALTKQLGRLEAQIEAKDSELKTLRDANAKREEEMTALTEVAQLAVDNLCVALGKPKERHTTASGITAAYNQLQTDMAKRFNTGRQSAETPTEDQTTTVASANFRHNV